MIHTKLFIPKHFFLDKKTFWYYLKSTSVERELIK